MQVPFPHAIHLKYRLWGKSGIMNLMFYIKYQLYFNFQLPTPDFLESSSYLEQALSPPTMQSGVSYVCIIHVLHGKRGTPANRMVLPKIKFEKNAKQPINQLKAKQTSSHLATWWMTVNKDLHMKIKICILLRKYFFNLYKVPLSFSVRLSVWVFGNLQYVSWH